MLASRVVHSDPRQVRAPRYFVNDLLVSSKTIGTKQSYILRTENVSRSGMLLAWKNNYQIPFLVNTILELTIDPSTSILKRPVECLGKVVRLEGDSKTNMQFGIVIVQIDNEDLENWDLCIEEISKKAQQLIKSSRDDTHLNLVMKKKKRYEST